MVLLGVATGCYYRREGYDLFDSIKRVADLKCGGIEFTLGNVDNLEKLLAEKERLDSFDQFSFKSVHAPNYTFDGGRKSKEILEKLCEFYSIVSASHIVFHPDRVIDKKVLNQFDWNVCYENIPNTKRWDEHFFRYLFKNTLSHCGFVFDTSHALLDDKFSQYLGLLKEFISYVHISYATREKEHMPLHKFPMKSIHKFKKLKNLNVPLIIELCNYSSNNVRAEFNFLREFFES